MSKEIDVNDPDYVPVPLKGAAFVTVYVCLALAIFLVSLDGTIISTAIPKIADEFQTLDQISWIGTGFLLTTASFTALYGSFCDIFGRKSTFLLAITLFEVGSLVCGIANSMTVLIIGRVVAGLGGAGILSTVMIIVSDIVSLRDRGKYQGVIGAVFGFSSVIGPLLGGVFTDSLNWRWCFLINLPIGGVVLLFIAFLLKFPVPEGSVKEKLERIDYIGTIFMTLFTVSILLPLQQGGSTWEWNSPQVITLFILGIVFAGVFAYTQARVSKYPLMPPSMFENSSVTALLFLGFLFGNAFYALIYYVPSYFQLVFGDSATQAGIEVIPLVFGSVLMSITSGLLISKTGRYRFWFIVGPIIMITGFALLSTMDPYTTKAQQIIYLIIAGLGAGMVMQTRILAMQASVTRANIALATGAINYFTTVGGSFGIAVAGTIFNNLLDEKLGHKLATIVKARPGLLKQLPEYEFIIESISKSLGATYYYCIPMAALMLVCALFIKEFLKRSTDVEKTLSH
ncbi:major facilitator superfamily domain-containing protein [Gorgonomyces haynaldii]|nr:major facilitator superfamily domain-containing protein [Gorgonomyces haynaldii]